MPKYLVVSTSGNPDSNSRRMGRIAFGCLQKAKVDCEWLVDDHADTRHILSRLLGKCGHEVFTAKSGQSALKLMETERFDALISDIGLLDTSGYELVREAKRRQSVQGIALSGFGMEEDVRRSLEAGFDYYLTSRWNSMS